MALLPRLPRHGPARNRIFQTGDPEPADHPNVISLSKVRFHWDAEGWYRCDRPDGPHFPWVYLIECFGLVSDDTSGCTHLAPGGEPG